MVHELNFKFSEREVAQKSAVPNGTSPPVAESKLSSAQSKCFVAHASLRIMSEIQKQEVAQARGEGRVSVD